MSDIKPNGTFDEVAGPATPEDVAILYSWANLPGAKYRDFSASRREYRAQQRARQAEEQRQAELASARALEETAKRDMEEAQRVLEVARRAEQEAANNAEVQACAEAAFRIAEANARREQEEAGRRQQSAETLRLRAQAARKEMMEARKRAEEQAARYAEFDAQYRAQMAERDEEPPGQLDDPYYYTGQVNPAYFASTPGVRTAQATRTFTGRKAYVFPMHTGSNEYDAGTLQRYRPSTTFAPSPAQDYGALSPIRNLSSTPEQDFEREQPSEQDRVTRREPEDVGNAAADNDYYSNSGRGLPARPPSTNPFRGYDTAEPKLHIRPRAQHTRYDEESASSTEPLIPVSESGAPWRSMDRPAGIRGRREAGADMWARTKRQPRVDEWNQPTRDQPPASTDSVPPAWLAYGEQPADSAGSSFIPAIHPHITPAVHPGSLQGIIASPAPNRRRFSESKNYDLAASSTDAGSVTEADRDRDEPLPRASSMAPDTLQESRERVASRWFALQGLMEQEPEPQPALLPPAATTQVQVPVFAVLALSGGVGKTSMVATLGRALSSLGEKVLLADTNTHGLLPYYFGARDLRPGAMRTFMPPTGSADAPVLVAHYEMDRVGHDDDSQERLIEDLTERAAGVQRVIVDVGGNGMWLARRLAYTSPFVLVPLAPDMNSILSTQATEGLFAEMKDVDGNPVRPYYVLNQYDPALPLHLDVREVLRQSLGDRLLPVMIHRAPAVSEALAEGMTVIDYAPGAPVAEDYKSLAHWIQNLSAPGTTGARGARWSER